MKSALLLTLGLFSSLAFASAYTAGDSSYVQVNNGGQILNQVSISGASAEALYNALTVTAQPITDEHGGPAIGAYKTGKNVSCSQTYGNYSCWTFVDANGATK